MVVLPFLVGDQDFWTTGVYSTFNQVMPFEQVVTILRTRYADQNPRVWDKAHNEWVVVA